MSKKGLNIFIVSLVVVIILSSFSFYELGFMEGNNAGYATGFSQGSSAKLISTFTEVKLAPNGTFYISPPPPKGNTVAIEYGIVAISSNGQNNVSADLVVVGGGSVIYNTGYHGSNEGIFQIYNATSYEFINIFIRANPQNSATITLEFNSPLQYIYGN